MLRTRTGSLGLLFLISRNTSSPLRPGIVMSRTTTSQFSFQILFNASWALRASPKVAFLNSSARICFKPWRTTAWSSVKRIFMLVQTGCTQRNRDGRQRSLAVVGKPDFEGAAEQRGPFLHTQKPHGTRVGNVRRRNSAAIVFHFQNNSSGGFFQMDSDVRGTRMPD